MGTEKHYVLDGLDCVHCAEKIEREIKGITGIESTSVNFINKKLYVKVRNSDDEDRIDEEITCLINQIEPDIIINKAGMKITTWKEYVLNNSNSIIIFLQVFYFITALAFQFPIWLKGILFAVSYIIVGEIVKRLSEIL